MLDVILNYIYNLFPKDYTEFEILVKKLKSGRISIRLYGNIAFWLVHTKTGFYLDLAPECEKAAENMENTQRRAKGIIRVTIPENVNNCESIFNIIYKAYTHCREHRAFEFDCCSKYMECSNAKKCVNDNRDLTLKCRYCSKLEHNIIFYGKNRNI